MTQLNRKHFAELFRVDYITVAVTFDDSRPGFYKQYTYKLPKTAQVSCGSKLLVRVDGNSCEYKVVTVQAVHLQPEVNSPASFNYKWALGLLDDLFAEHAANVARDCQLKVAVERLERALSRVELKTQLKLAMDTLPEEELREIQALFGQELLLKPTQEISK